MEITISDRSIFIAKMWACDISVGILCNLCRNKESSHFQSQLSLWLFKLNEGEGGKIIMKKKEKNVEKNNYLFRAFAKQKQQKENYIINAIYAKINEKELKPVTQQCVRIDGKYRKIDLFFPQINVVIECDEAYHKKRKEKDQKRIIEIEDKLNAVVLNQHEYKEIRVDATLSYEKLFKKIIKLLEL